MIVAGPIYDRGLLFLLRRNACSYVHGHTVGGINPTVLESLSTGTPVVARDTPYNREVLGEAGIYFDSADELVEALARVENADAKEWGRQSEEVADRLRDEFSWEYVVREYEAIARGVATAPGARRSP